MTRRDNGLPGGEWQRIADLAPPLADQVLEVLRDEGIAAYAAPSGGATGAYLETHKHPRPLDQVFVGRAQLTRARDVLDRLLPELHAELDQQDQLDQQDERADRQSELARSISTDDDVWAGIVAAYAAPPADPVGRWSATEDVEDGKDVEAAPGNDEAGASAGDLRPDVAAVDNSASEAGPATGFEDIRAELDALEAARPPKPGPADDPTDHYIPPPPPPLPQGDPVTRAAWAGVIGGPLFLILATVLGWGPGGITALVAVLAFVGGFITLVTRMGDERDDDGDNGAVV